MAVLRIGNGCFQQLRGPALSLRALILRARAPNRRRYAFAPPARRTWGKGGDPALVLRDGVLGLLRTRRVCGIGSRHSRRSEAEGKKPVTMALGSRAWPFGCRRERRGGAPQGRGFHQSKRPADCSAGLCSFKSLRSACEADPAAASRHGDPGEHREHGGEFRERCRSFRSALVDFPAEQTH